MFLVALLGNTVGNSISMGNHSLLLVPVKMSGKLWETMVGEHIRDGWKFRVKTSKGIKYITRRRGQKERGMGRFTEEHWSVIERLKQEHLGTDILAQEDVAARTYTPTESKNTEMEDMTMRLSRHEFLVKKIDDHIALYRGTVKMVGCMYNINNHCTYWTWSRRPPFFDHVDECFDSDLYSEMDIQVGDKIMKQWIFRASPWYCRYCSSFKKK